MERITIYHGSDHEIRNPQFGVGEVHNDYGQAFYCTFDLDMAKEWANKNMIGGVVNKYSLDCRGLKILDLTDKKYNSLNWIAILMHYRKLSSAQKESYRTRLEFLEKNFYIDLSQYDVVIGYRADDAYFKFPIFFIQNELSVERLEEIYNLGNLGKQSAIISKKGFKRIKFVSSIKAEARFHDQYLYRKNKADSRFEQIRIEEINSNKTKIESLMAEYDKRK